MNTSTHEKLKSLFADVFQVPPESLTPQSSSDSIPTWDSLQHLNMVLALEQEFGVQFTPEEIEQMLSLELVADLVNEKFSQREAG